VEPDLGGAEAALTTGQANGATMAGFRSVNVLLSASKSPEPLPADDIRSEFDLIVVHATSLALQPEATALAAHADLVVLVVREGAVESAAMRRATVALSRFGGVSTGLVINRVPAASSAPDRQAEALDLVG